jgi:hypothetical protein
VITALSNSQKMILKFTENAKKWLLKGEKGVKKGEND